jgi:hypothetical protein
MHSLLSIFQHRTDLILRGQIDEAVAGYVIPFWSRFRGTFYQITNAQDLWEALSRQHLSQKARGILSVAGELEDVAALPHGAQQVTVHWTETCDMRAGDTARWYRTVYVCRTEDQTLKTIGLTVTETRAVPLPPLPKVFPPPCADW